MLGMVFTIILRLSAKYRCVNKGAGAILQKSHKNVEMVNLCALLP